VRLSRRGDTVRIKLAAGEGELLAMLLDELAETLAEPPQPGAPDPVQDRLFPTAYQDDAEAAAEYRGLTESDLRSDRVARATRCRAELPVGAGRLELDPEAAQRWLTTLNDVRLVHGTRLEITGDEPHRLDPDDPQAPQHAIYLWLTAVQSDLVEIIVG
jgi:hypothetical protein